MREREEGESKQNRVNNICLQILLLLFTQSIVRILLMLSLLRKIGGLFDSENPTKENL